MSDAWIGLGVITEIGEPLGWVRKIIYNAEDNTPVSLVIATMPILWLPEIVTGSYLLSISEICHVSPNHLIAFEWAKEKFTCKTVGLLERIGLTGKLPWVITISESEQLYVSAIYRDDRDDGTGLSPMPKSPKPNPNPNFDEAFLSPN